MATRTVLVFDLRPGDVIVGSDGWATEVTRIASTYGVAEIQCANGETLVRATTDTVGTPR